MNDELRTDMLATVTVLLPCFDPELQPATKVTTKAPSLVKTWLGFLAVLVPPSPKFHCQEDGLPSVVSAN